MGASSRRTSERGPIASLLSSRRRTAVKRMMAAADQDVQAHARIAGSQRAEYEELLDALCAHVVEAFLEGRGFEDVRTRQMPEMARICADHAFTGDEILLVVRVCLKTAFEYVLEQSPPELVVDLMDFVAFCQPAVQSLFHGAVAAYHKYLLERGRAASPQELIGQALVCGNVADSAVAELNSDRLAPSTVLFLSCRGERSGEGAKHAWRRAAKRIERDDVFWALVGDDLALVLPGSVDKKAADDIHREAAQEMDTPFWSLVSPPVAVTEIQKVTRECQECVSSLRRLGYPAKCYDLRSLLFERIVLSADPGTLGQATQLIQQVTADTRLADTLTAWIAYHGHRAETAASLSIHPRTLDYRLRRIRALAGLDPTEPSAMSLLRCASIARMAENALISSQPTPPKNRSSQ